MCELMKNIQIYTEEPQLKPIYTLSETSMLETDAQRRSRMFAERKARKAEHIQLNQYWRATHKLLFQVQPYFQRRQAAEQQ